MKTKLYIGLVGSLASGKGIVADYFKKKHGFVSFSLSYIVHEELKKRDIMPITRKTLQDVGDDLRRMDGVEALAKRAVSLLDKEGSSRVVIEGIRNPGEITYLKKLPNFVLIAVDATRAIRYKRIIERGKPWDPKDWDSFLVVDSRDHEDEENSAGQQVKKCMNMADYIIENNKDLSHLYQEIEKTAMHISEHFKLYKNILT